MQVMSHLRVANFSNDSIPSQITSVSQKTPPNLSMKTVTQIPIGKLNKMPCGRLSAVRSVTRLLGKTKAS